MTEEKPPWRPLSERLAGLTGQRVLVEGTPEYLLTPLRIWLYDVIINRHYVETLTNLQLKLRRTDIAKQLPGRLEILFEGDDLLEAIDAVLDLHSWILADNSYANPDRKAWWTNQILDLMRILDQGGSAWTLNEGMDGLTTRVDQTVAQAVRSTISGARRDASDYLRRAWNAAYGFHPNPTLAYSEAVKAVEAITIPEVLPNDKDATLGKVLGELKSTKEKWILSIYDKDGQPAGGEALIAMIALLWHGQRDRHAGPRMKPATSVAAQMAVHTAATLVQWFTSGNVERA